ncbi:MAG: hypothetical protein ABSF67_23260 [Roseiarcus sp.]|jgi:tetratricopeptide (TPR) repeat protein
MPKDQQGLALAGAPESAAAFDRAVADYWGLTGDPVGVLKAALAADPSFVLGAIAIADLFLVGGFRGDHPEVMKALAAAEAAIGGASERERRHLAAAKAWAAGRAFDGEQFWDDILADHPTDALALRLVEDAHFFHGHSLAIRDSVARVLPVWERDNPLTSFVLGAYAFGLEESGELGHAEEVGREALAGNPADGWATHALAHVFETANRQEEGIAFLKSTRANWRPAHFMAGHNGWHLGAFLIELGRFDEVVADYDRFAAPKLGDDLTLDRVDAASLLWRLELAGVEVGDRSPKRGCGTSTTTCRRSTISTLRSPRRARPTPGTPRASAPRSTPISASAPAIMAKRSTRCRRRATRRSALAAAMPSATSSPRP